MASGSPSPRGVGEVLVTARPLDEYRAMFALSDADLMAGPILDCPGGAGAFACGVRRLGGRVVSVDPAYATPASELVAHARRETLRGNRYTRAHRDLYVWTFFRSLDDHRSRRLAALEEFAADFHGPDERYVAARLPRLPFADRSFRLVLSGHLLFTYPDHLDHAAHLAALRELVRLADAEVRLFPLMDTTLARYPRLDELRRTLAGEGIASEVRQVGYEFQRGGDEMLVLAPPGAG